MSQYESHFQDQAVPAEIRTSKLAISSLVCSLIFCCPLTTIPGIILGLIAIPAIGSNPVLKGKGLALFGILIGLGATALQVGVGIPGYRLVKDSYELMTNGPGDALAAGFSGDLAGFRASFHGAGATAGDEAATAFLDELTARYGAFDSCTWDQANTQSQFGATTQVVPYILTFDQATQSAEAEIMFADPSTNQKVFRLGSLTVLDPALGDLTYPPPGSGP